MNIDFGLKLMKKTALVTILLLQKAARHTTNGCLWRVQRSFFFSTKLLIKRISVFRQ